ncbi:hypothetical protein [Robertkochia aurantiaca]|uniref:hypothetical protein n=1 Tax=Robertkochia aurantiaca TaxID=2873700 RepID=UPI001CCC37F3|nr:hypothetical protein [Robertkochia sp. 3YJGBD-33]
MNVLYLIYALIVLAVVLLFVFLQQRAKSRAEGKEMKPKDMKKFTVTGIILFVLIAVFYFLYRTQAF